jgi:cobalt-zinc-cadmium efflux system membrane fusion protein
MKPVFILSFIAAGIFITSCGNTETKDENSDRRENLLTISREQFQTNNMQLGEPQRISFEETVKCNGNIVVQPSGVAMISTSVPGLVKKINCKTGQNVKAGNVLFELSGNEFVELQKDLAETASQLTRVRSEYERIKSLYNENVVTEKEFIVAESDYKAVNAKYSALKMKLNFIGLDDAKIENGSFYDSFSLKSPLNGNISQINISLGQYVDQQTNMAEILDLNNLQLKIAVFEKDLGKLSENQKISFALLGNSVKNNTATLKSIGKNVDGDSRSIMCFADIDDLKGDKFVNNAYVEAEIIIDKDTVTAVPEESIVKSGNDNYLFSLENSDGNNYFFKRIKVNTGRLSNGFIELLTPVKVNQILTRGTYYVPVE